MRMLKKIKNDSDVRTLRRKAAILDELAKPTKDKCLGHLMGMTEKEKNISLVKVKNMLRG